MGNCCINRIQISNVLPNGGSIPEGLLIVKKNESRNSKSSMMNISRKTSVFFLNNEDINTKYNFQKVIGKGFFGIVRIVSPKNDKNKKYACKSIIKSKLPENKISNLIREIETLSLVDHPNIIKFYETFNDSQYFHIIMELCTGGNLLSHVSKRTNFSEKEACELIYKITAALAHCHSLGIVHRDLKPENILFENKSHFSELKIIDFGLSRKYFKKEDLHSIVGSPYYVAPEVLEGAYDEKCDVWSIGILTYTLLCGRPPFVGKNKEEIFEKIRHESVTFPYKEFKGVSREAECFILQILHKNPNERPFCRELFDLPWLKQLEDRKVAMIHPKLFSNLKGYKKYLLLTQLVIKLLAQSLPEDYKTKVNEAFGVLDRQKSGLLSMTDIKDGIKEFNLKCDANKFEQVATKKYTKYLQRSETAPEKSAEMINYSAFVGILMDRKKVVTKAKLKEAFSFLDTDETGELTIHSFIKFNERTGKKKTPDEISKIFKEIGLKSDQFINFEMFCQIIEADLYES